MIFLDFPPIYLGVREWDSGYGLWDWIAAQVGKLRSRANAISLKILTTKLLVQTNNLVIFVL